MVCDVARWIARVSRRTGRQAARLSHAAAAADIAAVAQRECTVEDLKVLFFTSCVGILWLNCYVMKIKDNLTHWYIQPRFLVNVGWLIVRKVYSPM